MSLAGRLSAVAAVLLAAGSLLAWQRVPGGAVDVAALAAIAEPAEEGGPLDGRALFVAKGCAACHTGPDSTTFFRSLPSLADAPSWADDRIPDLSGPEYLAQSIREPWAFTSPRFSPGSAGPTTAMPALGLSEEEIDAVVEYLLAG